jgi:hypothetical protein
MIRDALRFAAVSFTFGLFIFLLGPLRAGPKNLAVPQDPNPKNSISYYIADGSGKPGYHPSDRELAQWALEAWQRSAANAFRLCAEHAR